MLQSHCGSLNTFFQNETLSAFAINMYEAGMITVELRDNPEYNEIERQFTATLAVMSTKEQFEQYCTNFLSALRSQGGPLELFADRIRDEWRDRVSTNLQNKFKFIEF